MSLAVCSATWISALMIASGVAQLVAGIGDEGALVLERVLRATEHRVQRVAEPGDLVVGGRDRQSRTARAGFDRTGASGHRLDRAQRRRGREVARQAREQQRDRDADEQLPAELATASSRASSDCPTTMIESPDRVASSRVERVLVADPRVELERVLGARSRAARGSAAASTATPARR